MSQVQSARSHKQLLDLHDKAESIFKERPSNEDPNLPKVLSNISHLNPDDDQLLYRPRKPTPVDFFTPQVVSEMKSTEIEEVKA